MSKVWITSDPHLGHKNIPKFRPQVNSVEHNSELFLENVLTRVSKRDVLWILGDVIFNKNHAYVLEQISAKVSQLNIVLGNHDTETTERKDLIKRLWANGVITNLHSLVSYKGVWLSHAPIHADELRGKMNVHGHLHTHIIDDPRYYNVCVDQTDMEPVLFQDVLAELKERNSVQSLSQS